MDEQKPLVFAGRQALSRRRFLTLAGLGTLALASGCAGFREPDYTIRMTDRQRFEPASLSVPVGSRVAFYNTAEHVHTATFNPEILDELTGINVPQGADVWDSGDVYTGRAWSTVLEVPGEFFYFCRYHARDGMVGVIRVVQLEME